jgi:uncharacterized membrane protein
MNIFVDIFMITLFFLFMVFIFGGYHKSKFAKREKESQALEEQNDLKEKHNQV